MNKEVLKKWEKNSPQHLNAWANQNSSNAEDPAEMRKKIAESYGEYQFRQFWYNSYPKESRVSDPIVKEFIRHIWLAIYQSPLSSKLVKGENQHADYDN